MKRVILRVITVAFAFGLYSQVVVAQSALFISPDGDVGVGTDTPLFLLHAENFAIEPTITIHNTGDIGGATFRMIDVLSGADFKFKATSKAGFKIRDHGNSQDVITIEAQSGGVHAIYVDETGNVGIGPTTKNVATALSVNGVVEARDYVVTDTSISWPDYVFDEYYTLMPLDEVEEYTLINSHLPGVPSESEIAENGINVGEMTAIQMEKIEELTLYLIALKKQNEALSDRIRSLEENQSN